MNTPTAKTKEEIKNQCKTFLEKNNMKMVVIPKHSEYGDMEVDGYEIFLLPQDSPYWFSSDVREHGIRIGYSS